MKQSLILFCILVATWMGNAQDKNFDLSKYKFPDYKRHEMELNFNSSGNSSRWSAIYENTGDGISRTIDYKDSYNNSNIELGYSLIKNTRKRQENIYSSLRSSYRFDKSVDELGTSTFSSPIANLNISVEEKYYLTENKWFLEVDPQFDSEIWSVNEKSPTIVESKRRGNRFYAQLGLGAGIGRMELVSDYWQAYYILGDLKKQGSLLRDLEEKDIYEFATLASQLKNKRFFDSRLKKIDEMKSIDSLMQKQHLTEHGDISYFTTLNDYWNFANISYRSSGRVLKILLTPVHGYRFDKELGKITNTIHETNLSTGIDFSSAKQLNLFWERYFHLSLSNQTKFDENGSIIKYPKNFQGINSGMSWNYYPNFRTQFKTSISYIGSQFASGVNQDETKYKKAWSNALFFLSSAYYYLSPQLRIEASIRAYYIDKRHDLGPKEKLDITYSLGFRYAIF